MFFSRRLKEKRLEMGLTQKELGDLLGASKTIVCNWEKAKKKPSSKNMIQLSKILNASMEHLIANDSYVISENEEKYGLMMAKEEIDIIKELRNHKDLYEQLTISPKRTFDRIDKILF